MKTKIELTKEQVDKLVAVEEKQLRVKLEKDLASLRKKYEFVELEIQVPTIQSEKTKLTDEIFNKYLSEGKNVKEIAVITGYNEGYIYKMKKRILSLVVKS
jgi:hypothetical protein